MAMVPQLVPVASAMRPASTNVSVGNSQSLKVSFGKLAGLIHARCLKHGNALNRTPGDILFLLVELLFCWNDNLKNLIPLPNESSSTIVPSRAELFKLTVRDILYLHPMIGRADIVELIRAGARFTVSYGEDLRFAGGDLPRPSRTRVPTRHGRVPVRLYRPGPGSLPIHVHLHGGAFLMRHPGMDDWWCRYVAAKAGVVVANVDFEVAPRVTYPVAQHQAHDVAAHLASDGTPVSVGGFSSGGGLAASVALAGCATIDGGEPAELRIEIP